MQRIAALDYGRVRIGLAISDLTQTIAQPIGRIANDRSILQNLKTALQKWQPIEKIIIGLPLQMSGQEGIMAKEVRAFATAIVSQLQIPFEFIDERLSTAQIERAMKEDSRSRKQRSLVADTLSATLLLQNYLGI